MLRLKNNKGQILVEYLLLMVIAVGCATFMAKTLISRKDKDNPGLIIKAWTHIISTIGNDLPECPNQKVQDFKTGNCPP